MVDSERSSHAGRRCQRQHGSVRYPKVAEKAKRVSLGCEKARGHLVAKRADECEDVLFRPPKVCERKLVKHGQRVLRVDAASLQPPGLSRGLPWLRAPLAPRVVVLHCTMRFTFRNPSLGFGSLRTASQDHWKPRMPRGYPRQGGKSGRTSRVLLGSIHTRASTCDARAVFLRGDFKTVFLR